MVRICRRDLGGSQIRTRTIAIQVEKGSVPAMSEPIKYLDMDEFRDGGYLQEVNRRFFHPLGLALEWSSGWSREQVIIHLQEIGIEPTEETIEAVWQFLHSIKMDQSRISGVWDYRDDPEGMAFSDHPNETMIDRAKTVKILREEGAKADARIKLLGSVVQAVPEGHAQEEG